MPSIINATTSPPALVQSSDGTAVLKIQVADQDAIFIDANRSVTVNTNLTVAGANVLTSSSINVSNILFASNIGTTVQAYDANILFASNIGTTVQAYDANTAKYDDTTSNFTGILQKSGANVLTVSGGTMTGDITFNGSQTFPGTVTTGKAIAMAIVFGG